tara:strand:- start:342 stop:1940 length:1599 start_codon:yes stop_codon:yes gene_type:complete
MEDFKSILNGTIGEWPLSNGLWTIKLIRAIEYGNKINKYTLLENNEEVYSIPEKNSTSRSDDKDDFSEPIDLLNQVNQLLPSFQNYILNNYKPTSLYYENWSSLPTVGVFESLTNTDKRLDKNTTCSGVVLNKDTGLGLKGVDVKVYVDTVVFSTKTDSKGAWSLSFTCKVIYPDFNNDTIYEVVQPLSDFNFTKAGYNKANTSSIKGDKTLKTTASVVNLDSKEKSKSQDLSRVGTLDEKNIKALNKGGVKNPPNISKLIHAQVKIIVNRLIPVIIGMLAKLGITQIDKWLDGTNTLDNTDTNCPEDSEEIKSLIRKRNRLVRQLNNIYRVVDTAVKGLGILATLISIFKTILNIFKYMPLPTTLGLPPGPQGGVILSASYGKITRYIEKFDDIRGKIDLIEKLTLTVLSALVLLRIYLLQSLQLLKILDNKLDQCAQGLDIEQEEIDNELTELLIAEEEDGNPVVIDVNGFTMGVEVSKTKVGSLNRRFATASDAQGVVLLKGEPSFSASDQILIDELVFYIQSNNLKAQ